MNNLLIQFVIDAVKRFTSKTPWFHKVLQGLSAVAFTIVNLPATLDYFCANQMICITLPISIDELYRTAVSIATVVIMFTAQFSVTTPSIALKKIKE
jgi:hypothetical protein